MPVHNSEIARIFNRVADLLELEDANPFRIRAYRARGNAPDAERRIERVEAEQYAESLTAYLKQGRGVRKVTVAGGYPRRKETENGRLPDLVDSGGIRGDLHAHTRATDGRATLEEMAAAARERGYDDLAITEHSRRVTMARGLDADRLAGQIDTIDRLNDGFDGFRLLKGIEVDILEDGSLDLPDDVLARLDLRVCSVHYRQGLSRKKQTER